MQKRGYHDFPLKFFLSQSAEKCRAGALQCFRKFRVSKNFTDKRGRGYHVFPLIFFLSQCQEISWGNPFNVSEKFGYQNLSCRGGHHGFVEFFFSHRTETKNFVGEPFCVSENFWYQKILWIRGGGGEEEGGSITISRRNEFVS